MLPPCKGLEPGSGMLGRLEQPLLSHHRQQAASRLTRGARIRQRTRRGSATSIDWTTAHRVSDSKPQPIRWLVEGVIPADTATLISSQSGVGKSMLGLHLALSLGIGLPWLGVQSKRAAFAYWDQDNPDSVLTTNRMCAIANGLGISITDVADSFTFRARSIVLNRPREMEQMAAVLTGRGIGVLFVDTLASVNPWGEGEEICKVVTEGMAPIMSASITPIILHHMGKSFFDQSGQRHLREGGEAARGHSSLIASVGAAYNLVEGAEGARTLKCAKPRYGRQPDIHIIYDEDSDMGLPDWKVTISSSGVRVSQENLTQMIASNGWQGLSSRKLVHKLELMGLHASQSTASRALSESK